MKEGMTDIKGKKIIVLGFISITILFLLYGRYQSIFLKSKKK